MSPADLGMGVFGADAALYGFVIAYWTFSRSLQEQEKSRILAQMNSKVDPAPKPHAELLWKSILRRAVGVDLFLLLCTILAPFPIAFGIYYLSGIDSLLAWEVGFFVAFLSVVLVWAGLIAILNSLQNLHQLRDYPNASKAWWGLLRRDR